jgi:hypothetical protein
MVLDAANGNRLLAATLWRRPLTNFALCDLAILFSATGRSSAA